MMRQVKNTSSRLTIDIMVNNGKTFYKTVKYEYCPIFRFDAVFKSMIAWINNEVPSVKTRKGVVLWIKFPTGEELESKLS